MVPTLQFEAAQFPKGTQMISIDPKHKNLLHEKLHVKAGEKIPVAKEEAAKHSSDPKEREEANFALNARKFNRYRPPV